MRYGCSQGGVHVGGDSFVREYSIVAPGCPVSWGNHQIPSGDYWRLRIGHTRLTRSSASCEGRATGMSMGGNFLPHPNRIRAIVLVSATMYFPGPSLGLYRISGHDQTHCKEVWNIRTQCIEIWKVTAQNSGMILGPCLQAQFLTQ